MSKKDDKKKRKHDHKGRKHHHDGCKHDHEGHGHHDHHGHGHKNHGKGHDAGARQKKAASAERRLDHQAYAINTDEAPAALGPYSQAVVKGSMIFASGQLGIDPASGRMPEGVSAQTAQALANLEAVLQAAGSSLEQVVKTTCFLTNLSLFDAFNAEYAKHFANEPARECVQVAALPKDACVEVSAIAMR